MGCIGVGRMGRGDMRECLYNGLKVNARVVAVCDLDANRAKKAAEEVDAIYRKEGAAGKQDRCRAYSDHRELLAREDIDGVTISTPDHWHALCGVAAARAGKDIYLQKPLTYTIGEGRALVGAVRKHKRVLQTGSQQRSSIYFRMACELARNGRIGKLHTIRVFLPEGEAEDFLLAAERKRLLTVEEVEHDGRKGRMLTLTLQQAAVGRYGFGLAYDKRLSTADRRKGTVNVVALEPIGDNPASYVLIENQSAGQVGWTLPDGAGPDSVNRLPVLLQEKEEITERPALVTASYLGFLTIRQGKWKAIFGTKWSGGHPGGNYGGPAPKGMAADDPDIGQLYDISVDPFERKDLWERRPEVVKSLRRELERVKQLDKPDEIRWQQGEAPNRLIEEAK